MTVGERVKAAASNGGVMKLGLLVIGTVLALVIHRVPGALDKLDDTQEAQTREIGDLGKELAKLSGVVQGFKDVVAESAKGRDKEIEALTRRIATIEDRIQKGGG